MHDINELLQKKAQCEKECKRILAELNKANIEYFEAVKELKELLPPEKWSEHIKEHPEDGELMNCSIFPK